MANDISHRYVQKVADMPKLQHAAVRVGLWLAALAERKGGFPVTLFASELISGYDKDGIVVPGVSFRIETVMKSIEALQEHGLLQVKDAPRTFGRSPKEMTLLLD